MPIRVGDRIQIGTISRSYVHDVCPAQIPAGAVAIRTQLHIAGSRSVAIVIPSAPAVAAATIAAHAVTAAGPAPNPPASRSPHRSGGRADRGATDPRLPPPGTAVLGRYKGETFQAEILDDGKVAMDGVEYATLSAAAKAARGGIPTSGFVFFGL